MLFRSSYNKPLTVSSAVDSLPAENMTDENIRTYWAAETGDSDEFAVLDMENVSDVYAVQVNFAEHFSNLFGRQKGLPHRYMVEYSNNTEDWTLLIDQSQSKTDHTHNYHQLSQPVSCRYLKLSNIKVPDGQFAVSGFRAFGTGHGAKPQPVTTLNGKRKAGDRRVVHLDWNQSDNATGYVISCGNDKNKLYNHYMVYQDTTLSINSLNAGQSYYITIEAFNENGITPGERVMRVD